MIAEYGGGNIDTGIVRFTADWCVPCKQFAPVFEQVARQYDVDFYVIDVEQYPDVAQAHGVMSIPAVFAVNNGAWHKLQGVPSAQTLHETALGLADGALSS